MFWTVGLEIDVPQTNPTTRDRLPFPAKREILAEVHRRRQHGLCGDAVLAGRRVLESLVCPALCIACYPMPHLLHQHHRRVHKCPELLLLLLLRRKHPMWPKLGLPGSPRCYINATTAARCGLSG